MTKKTSVAQAKDEQPPSDPAYVRAYDQPGTAEGVYRGEPDYHEVSYLRQSAPEAPWTAHSELFPTRDEATDRAFSLNASGHKAIKVSPRYWGA